MKSRLMSILLLGTFSGCASSPPAPPSPDESTRRPVNSAAAVELQSCQANLTNTRLLLDEASHTVERTGSAMAQLAEHCDPPARIDEAKPAIARTNTVYVVFFQYAEHEIRVPDEEVERLVGEAKGATNILVRGRTDAAHENAFDTVLAARRANAVFSLLVDHGVDPSKIRLTYQGQGDVMAPNTDEKTRALNRRAEIEIYRAVPEVVLLGNQSIL